MIWPFPQIRAALERWLTHQDKVKPSEIRREYGWNAQVADRPWKDQYNLQAHLVNANVSIAIRAITDAIMSLHWEIVSVENIGGVERETEDREHPANEILKAPNPDMAWEEIIENIVKSYLGDGNAILTMERMTGPNPNVEIWPRDPRPPYVKQAIPGGRLTGYWFGNDERDKRFYPKERVIHVRDQNPENPLWGVPRIEPVRLEIEMDYLVNMFNRNFFKNGAVLNLTWNPKENLSEIQHDALLEQWEARRGDPDMFFRPMINMFAGAWSTPDQVHKDIAFLDLLKHNREKIFGVFGLPPFRGGVMEYANYANALAQDKDFWNNTVKPVTKKIEIGLNQQLIQRLFDESVRLRCNYSEVPALKGEPKEQAEIDVMLVKAGILTANEVRENRNLEPIEEPEPPDDTEDMPEETPSKDEEEKVGNALLHVFSQERATLRAAIRKYTHDGSLMSRLVYPEAEVTRLLSRLDLYAHLQNEALPAVVAIARNRINYSMQHYVPDDAELGTLIAIANNDLLGLAEEMQKLLQTFLGDAMTYGWTVSQLLSRVNGIFAIERAKHTAHMLARWAVKHADDLATRRRLGLTPQQKEAQG